MRVNGWEKIVYANGHQSKARVAYYNKYFKTKTSKRQRRSLYNDKGINPTRGGNICKYLCIQHRSN